MPMWCTKIPTHATDGDFFFECSVIVVLRKDEGNGAMSDVSYESRLHSPLYCPRGKEVRTRIEDGKLVIEVCEP